MLNRISPASIAALCIANGLIAIAAVAFRLTAHDVMRMYWVEIGVIGLYTAAKIAMASEAGLVGRTKPYKIVLFGAHYGTFWVFYTQILSFIGRGELVPLWLTLVAFAVYLLAHAVTFKFATWNTGELRSVTSFAWMAVPYGRVIPLHAALLAIHIVLEMSGVVIAPILIVGAKFVLDVPAHAFEHNWVVPKLSRTAA